MHIRTKKSNRRNLSEYGQNIVETNSENTRKNCHDFADFHLVIEMNNDSTNSNIPCFKNKGWLDK